MMIVHRALEVLRRLAYRESTVMHHQWMGYVLVMTSTLQIPPTRLVVRHAMLIDGHEMEPLTMTESNALLVG